MNILIIEDEAAASARLQKMIISILPEANILAVIVSIHTAVEWLNSNPSPDLIFLDIHLSDGQSFEIFNQIKVTVPIIFTTAYDQYALDAFKLHSIDYLLKPIKKEDLKRAIDKFLFFTKTPEPAVNFQQLLSTVQTNSGNHKQRFIIRYGEHIKTIETKDIAYFYTENKVNFLVTAQNKRFTIDYNLDQLESLVDPKKFFRINRQFIVGFSAIAEMFSYTKSRVLLRLNPASKHETIVSSERSGAFKSWLDE